MSWKYLAPALCAAALAATLGTPNASADKKEYAADKGPDKVDVSAYPANIQAAYKVFAAKCSKCHTLARPINTNMTVGEWKQYVKRMQNKPKSGIEADDGKQIFTFLKFYQKEKDSKK